jgi:hypothetical protein
VIIAIAGQCSLSPYQLGVARQDGDAVQVFCHATAVAGFVGG